MVQLHYHTLLCYPLKQSILQSLTSRTLMIKPWYLDLSLSTNAVLLCGLLLHEWCVRTRSFCSLKQSFSISRP